MTVPNLERFENFLHRLTRLIDGNPAESVLLPQAKDFLHELVKQDDWLVNEFAQAHAQHYQQYLLYLDPKERFSIVSFVWGPAQATPIHDHTVWGLVGMLRGVEHCQPYSKMQDGRWVAAGLELELYPGDVEVISPKKGDVHRVWNASQTDVAVSIHVYGGNIGQIQRHVYEPSGLKKPFISGYVNDRQAYPFEAYSRLEQPQPKTAPSLASAHPLIDVPAATLSSKVMPTWVSKSVAPNVQSATNQKVVTASSSNAVAATLDLQPLNVKHPQELRGTTSLSMPVVPQEQRVMSTQDVSHAQVNAAPATHSLQGMEPFDEQLHCTAQWVRQRWIAKEEVALLDVREEHPFAQGHPLFAANMPLSRIEVDAPRRIPLKSTPIVVYDHGEGLVARAMLVLKAMGYSNVKQLHGGLQGWIDAGAEVFQDVNSASKAFGEWVCEIKKTPHVSAQQLKLWLDQNADVVVLDARRYDEYQTMSIPHATSVPGGELVLKARSMAPNATTRIVVNCAGRTRSIIGTQSLINAGIPNPVCALENGTIGWVLAGLDLEQGQSRQCPTNPLAEAEKSKLTALALAIRAGVKRMDLDEFHALSKETDRNTYLFDVRSKEEFDEGHLPQAIHAPAGQLVQETDHWAAVRGARVVLYDVEGVRAHVCASWLSQMGWDVHVIKNLKLADLRVKEPYRPAMLKLDNGPTGVSPEQLKEWLANRVTLTLVIDVGMSADYVKKHIAGAWWLLRSQMQTDFSNVHRANRYVVTCSDGLSARFAAQELRQVLKSSVEVFYLEGGNASWFELGYSSQQGESYLASQRIDRYQRPYEGTHNSAQAMQAYLNWEFGLVEQLKRDGTHGFKVI